MKKINETLPQSKEYLQILDCIAKPAKKLYYIGGVPKNRIPTVAIVGSRKITRYGKEVTEKITRKLVEQGVVIVSGLAYGVDEVAHKTAVELNGKTIAVLAHGLHKIYPSRNRDLAEKIIAKNGCLISEYPEGTEALKHRFLERNRIVSGLSDIVIITEAAANSGTLNTATHALEQGKQLFVVPGNITSPTSAGCNKLLLQGATPLLDSSQIIEALNINSKETSSQQIMPFFDSNLEEQIYLKISSGVRDADSILEQLDVAPSEFSTALTMLEINDYIVSHGANIWSIK